MVDTTENQRALDLLQRLVPLGFKTNADKALIQLIRGNGPVRVDGVLWAANDFSDPRLWNEHVSKTPICRSVN